MPKLGLTMTEATLVEWLKADGDPVEKGEPLFVLESEKSTLEIEAPASGTLHILVPAGQTVPVHTPIATMVGAERASAPAARPLCRSHSHRSNPDPQFPASNPRSPPPPKPAPWPAAWASRWRASPAPGRGAWSSPPTWSGRQRQAAPKRRRSPAGWRPEPAWTCPPSPAAVPAGASCARTSRRRWPPSPNPLRRSTAGRRVQPLSGLRAIIAERLSASWRERPHVTLTTEADATNLVSARQQLTAELGQKVAYDALLVALVARALREYPYMNVRLTERGIEQLAQVNVGVAVDTERGLLVPVVRDAAAKSLLQVQHTLAELVERALAGRSLPDDLSGGTFTITNLGMFEIDAFTPIINPPESAILGVGRIVAKPVAVDRPGRRARHDDPQPVLRPPADRRRPGRPLFAAGQAACGAAFCSCRLVAYCKVHQLPTGQAEFTSPAPLDAFLCLGYSPCHQHLTDPILTEILYRLSYQHPRHPYPSGCDTWLC